MSVVHVAVPMLRGSDRFKIEKGRRWSVVEHLMLDAVADEPASAAQLSISSKLPRRIVVEAFIRLMRVGWVEIMPGNDGPIFRATDAGIAQADSEEMRAATVVQYRWMSFAIDRVAGSIFRGREVIVRSRSKVQAPEGEQLVFLEPSYRHSAENIDEVYTALENEDEVILGTETVPESLYKGYAVFEVRDGVLESLPGRARDELKTAILVAANAAGSSPQATPGGSVPAIVVPAPTFPPRSTEGLFEQDDLILDGAAHRNALECILGCARQKVFVHSTFVTSGGWQAAFPQLLRAASRGVKVHVFWGQDDDSKGNSTSRSACDTLRAAIVSEGRADHIIVHPFTTGSHAKLLISDDGQGGWLAMVGSCNWLSADFGSFDASIRMRDPTIVGEMVCHLASLAVGSDGIWNRTAGELTVLGRRIASLPHLTGRRASLRVLLGADHADAALEARDRSARRMLVASHRIGIAGKPMTIIPALSAAQTKGVGVSLYYGRPTGNFSGKDAANLAVEMRRNGVNIRPVHQPRLHAKVLAWDDDALAVTSLNWLSADPSEKAIRSEIGILVEMNKIADTFVRRFEHAIAAP